MVSTGKRTVLTPVDVSISNTPSADATHWPRVNSRMSPPARTIVRASTHSRTVPYLKVAAPAALVATAPPAKAPRNVGTGGSQRPLFPSASCTACNVTPAPTCTRSRRCSMVFSNSVAMTTSPCGVAPPVSEDCAPTGSTRAKSRRHAESSAIDRGRATPLASPPEKCAASSRNRAVCAGSRSGSTSTVDGGLAMARDRTSHIVPCTNRDNAAARVMTSYEDGYLQLNRRHFPVRARGRSRHDLSGGGERRARGQGVWHYRHGKGALDQRGSVPRRRAH